jgi:hypothetical protein
MSYWRIGRNSQSGLILGNRFLEALRHLRESIPEVGTRGRRIGLIRDRSRQVSNGVRQSARKIQKISSEVMVREISVHP